MELERFWSIIEDSRAEFDPNRADGNMDAQIDRLRDALTALPLQGVGSFSNTVTKLFHDAYRWDLWAAGYIIEGGCGDDGFTDFRYWLISMGRNVYDNAMNDVESLADIAFGPGIEITRFEEFGCVADDILCKMNASEDDAGIMDFEHPDSPAGEEWEDDDLPKRFPRLTAAAALYRDELRAWASTVGINPESVDAIIECAATPEQAHAAYDAMEPGTPIYTLNEIRRLHDSDGMGVTPANSGFVFIGYCPNGDQIALDIANDAGSIWFVGHETMHSTPLREIAVRVADNLRTAYDSIMTDPDFPIDYYAAKEKFGG